MQIEIARIHVATWLVKIPKPKCCNKIKTEKNTSFDFRFEKHTLLHKMYPSVMRQTSDALQLQLGDVPGGA